MSPGRLAEAAPVAVATAGRTRRAADRVQRSLGGRLDSSGLGDLLSGLAVILLGTSGVLASIRGWGSVVMFPAVQREASITIVFVAIPIVAFMTAVRDRPRVRLIAGVASALTMAVVTASTSGRVSGLVAGTSLAVAHFVLLDKWPEGRPGGGVAVWALVPFAASQASWAVSASALPTFSLLGCAAFVVTLHRREARALLALDRIVRSVRYRFLVLGRAVGDSGVTMWRGATRVAMMGGQAVRRLAEWPPYTIQVAVVLAAMILAAPVFYRFATVPGAQLGHVDFQNHLWWASQIEFLPPRLAMPHPMLHVPTALLGLAIGPAAAIATVVAAAVGLTVVVLVRLGTERFAGRPGLDGRLAVLFAAGYLVVESPSLLASAFRWGNSNDWTAINHMYLSPTETVLIPFAVVLLLLVRDAVVDDPQAAVRGRRQVLLLALATVAATLAKPTMPVILMTVLPVYLLMTRRITIEVVRVLALGLFLPGLAVVAWQFWFVRSGGALTAYGTGGFAFEPLGTIRSVGLDRMGPLVLAPLLVIPICLWVGPRRYLKEPAAMLSLGCLLASLPLLFLLQETGPRASEANFAKPAFISWVLLHVMSWRFLVGEFVAARGERRWPAWCIPAALMLVLGVAAGTLGYLDAIGVIDLPAQGSVS